mmetsp:Transcript_30235/g.39864  ORF Transcript_30235/g.39864 Transcript_30235/m.39864 type:complete len:223 (+) Transcript_30235:116-784(+)
MEYLVFVFSINATIIFMLSFMRAGSSSVEALICAPLNAKFERQLSSKVSDKRFSGMSSYLYTLQKSKKSEVKMIDEESKFTIEIRGQTIEATKGQRLRTALLRNGVSPHNGKAKLINCRGLGTCGTCAVEIQGRVLPEKRTQIEDVRLSFPPFTKESGSNLRLACQCFIHDNLVLTKYDEFWGQGSIPSDEDAKEFFVPFRELEYILDNDDRPTAEEQTQGL